MAMSSERPAPAVGPAPVARVLVVDDDPVINRLVQARLAGFGYEIHAAADGEQALALAQQVQPDLVLLDVQLPGISGLEVLDYLRSTQMDLAVIMITAYGSEQVAVNA